MKKLDRINELVDELNELKLGCMAASLDSLEQNIAEISEQTETGASCRRTSIIG